MIFTFKVLHTIHYLQTCFIFILNQLSKIDLPKLQGERCSFFLHETKQKPGNQDICEDSW